MKRNKIWVSDDWYISVDGQGYVLGPCFEGILSYILQLEHADSKLMAAIKIPRLSADTVEENAYICRLTQEEVSAVIEINVAGSSSAGLLAAQFFGANPLIRRRSTSHSFSYDAQMQHDHVIFVSFERDRRPRLCSVNLTEAGFSVFPEGCREDLEQTVSKADWERFIGLTRALQLPDFSITMYRWQETETEKQGELLVHVSGQNAARAWYAAIPSMIFEWSQEDLQQDIAREEIKSWSLRQHFTLFEQVLRGVGFLHKHNMIHGDIRPANIVRVGPPEPEKYRLGDYGSYGRRWHDSSAQEGSGHLIHIDPGIAFQRQTPFYSPERRSGFEFESANVAIIKRTQSENVLMRAEFSVLLGWRSELLLPEGGIRDDVKQIITGWESDKLSDLSNTSLEQLQPGDRLRVRDFLFEIRQSGRTTTGLKIYRCKGEYAHFVHNRLLVQGRDHHFDDWTIVDLSGYVEFHQWSAATDLYAVGALCLYTLFSCGLQVQSERKHPADGRSSETLFIEMIGVLESIPYFNFFWHELEVFRQTVEHYYTTIPQPSSRDAATIMVTGSESMSDMALRATNNILKSTPNARIILEQFHFNVAHFLLFMHFVLACLHRESHLTAGYPDWMTPFAKDRTELPEDRRAAYLALQRLLEIKSYLSQPFFAEFSLKEVSSIRDFDPRSDFQLRIEFENLRRESVGSETNSLGGY